MQLKLSILCLLLLQSIVSLADEEYEAELSRFFKSTVMVDANYVRSTNSFFWIKINDVIRDDSLGLKKGDYLKVENKVSSCGFPCDMKQYKRAYFYLTKIPNGWQVYHRTPSSIRNIRKDSMYIGLPDTVLALSGKEFRIMMKEVSATFIWNSSCHHADLKISSDNYLIIREINPIIKQLSLNRRYLDIAEFSERRVQMVSLPDEPRKLDPEPQPPQHCGLLENQPYYIIQKPDSIIKYIQENLQYPNQFDFQGKVYVEFIVEKSGELSNFKVLRGLHPIYDSAAVEVFKHMPRWEPAINRGRKERCKYIVPVQFSL